MMHTWVREVNLSRPELWGATWRCPPVKIIGRNFTIRTVRSAHPGDYSYYCTVHPNMKARLQVQ
jgi:hypothetical protein